MLVARACDSCAVSASAELAKSKAKIVVAVGYAKFFSRSHDAVIRVYAEAGDVIETPEHTGDFREW